MMQQESSRNTVLKVMQDGIPRSDAEIEATTGLSHGKASGARVALWEQGFVERLEKDAQGHRRWKLCPPERQAEARQAYRDHVEGRERSRLAAKDVGERASIVAFLLTDDEVNAAVLAHLERSRVWRRAQGRANDVRSEKEAVKRARRREINRAEGAHLEFLTALDRLREGIDALLAMRHQLEEARLRSEQGESTRIPPGRWPALAKNVREMLEVAQILFRELAEAMDEPMDSCPLCGERLLRISSELNEGYVDAEVVEETTIVKA